MSYVHITGHTTFVSLWFPWKQVFIIIIIIIPRQCLWCCHHGRAIARVHPVHLMNTAPSGRQPKTKPGDLGCKSACTGCQSLHPPSPFIMITQPESWYSFYRPTQGRRLSRPNCLVTYWNGLPIHRRSPIRVLTESDLAQLRWSSMSHCVCFFLVLTT